MRRPQFTLGALLVAMLAAGCFFGGIRFERERQRWADEAAMAKRRAMSPLISAGVAAYDVSDFTPQYVEYRKAADEARTQGKELTFHEWQRKAENSPAPR